MTPVPIFHGRVSLEGRLELEETERDQRRLQLDRLRGHAIEFVIRRERTRRSLDMNAYLHAVPFPIIAEHVGDDIAGAKFDLMGECWGWRTTKAGHRIPVKGHTSEMTVEESAYFVDWLIPWAMKTFGLVIPLPRETDV